MTLSTLRLHSPKTTDRQKPLIVGIVSAAYLPILANWLISLKALGIQNIKVFALDAVAANCVEQWGIDVDLVDWDGSLPGIWKKRPEIFRQLIEAGIEFVHSDIDAIWLRDPFAPGFALGNEVDLAFSQGTVWPPDVYNRQGFVLCCGWFLARPTPAVGQFFSDLAEHVNRSGNDQESLNQIVVARGISWNRPSDFAYQMNFRDKQFDCWTKPILGRYDDDELTIALLPHREFQRIEEDYDAAYVKHFVSPKNTIAKLEMLERFGLLYLRDAKVAVVGKSLAELTNTDI